MSDLRDLIKENRKLIGPPSPAIVDDSVAYWEALIKTTDALESRLDAEVGDIGDLLNRLEDDTSSDKHKESVDCIRQLLEQRDEAQYLNKQWEGYPDLLIERDDLKKRLELQAKDNIVLIGRVKGLEDQLDMEGVFPIDWEAVRKSEREQKP